MHNNIIYFNNIMIFCLYNAFIYLFAGGLGEEDLFQNKTKF